jgi:hypothetical protein
MFNTAKGADASVAAAGLGADSLVSQAQIGAQNTQAMWEGLARQQEAADARLASIMNPQR